MAETPIDDGGPAFPSFERIPDDESGIESTGMTLRDYMAAKAMQAVHMPQSCMHDHLSVYDRVAQHAYKMADAMLKARNHG